MRLRISSKLGKRARRANRTKRTGRKRGDVCWTLVGKAHGVSGPGAAYSCAALSRQLRGRALLAELFELFLDDGLAFHLATALADDLQAATPRSDCRLAVAQGQVHVAQVIVDLDVLGVLVLDGLQQHLLGLLELLLLEQ